MNDGPPGVRVLVVGSDLHVCDVLARFLMHSGLDPEVAIGPAEALAVLDEGQGTIVVHLDGQRSRLQGFLLAVRARHPRTRVLGLGSIDSENIRPDVVFPLPVDPQRVVNWINE